MLETAIETMIYIQVVLWALILLGMTASYCWRKYSRNIKESYTRKLCECLQPQDQLPDVVFPDIQYSFNRRILLQLLSDLSVMLEGVEGRILRLIFHENGLDYHIQTECRLHDDHRKIRALSVFIDIPLPEGQMPELQRFLNSRNNELQMVALLVWLNQKPEEMAIRLSRYPHPLSDRECSNMYALGQRHALPISDVRYLLDSPNPYVRRFGRKVITINNFQL